MECSISHLADDHLFIVLKPGTRRFVDSVFSAAINDDESNELPARELRLKGNTKVADLKHSYGIQLDVENDNSLEQVLKNALNQPPQLDSTVELEDVQLSVREMVGHRIITVGVLLLAGDDEYDSKDG